MGIGYNRGRADASLNMPHQARISTLYWIFAFSGLSGLIYESIWSRYLGLFLGHAAYAQSLVLMIFMGGMACGAALCGRRSRNWPNLLRTYAVIEGVVGIFALFFHEVFRILLNYFFDHLIPATASPVTITFSKWSVATALILPQSILLGMTFPLMSGGIIRRFPERPGGTLGMLYFTNSIGGVVGVLAAGFWLIRELGLPGTMRFAGIVNICLGLTVWHIGKTPEQPFAPVLQREGVKGQDYWILLMVALLTGSASFIYEIAWIRMLSMVLGSSTHSFELMLSAFILGLALGSLWIRRRIERIRDATRGLALVQLAMGVLALATLVVYGGTFGIMQWILNAVPKSDLGYLIFNFSSHGIAMLVMLPATFCAGMTLPLITYVLLRKGFGEKTIGIVYSANTVGAIIGVLLAVHVGMPFLGLRNLIVSGAATDIALGLVLLTMSWNNNAKVRHVVGASAAIAAILVTMLWVPLDPYRMASGVFRRAQNRLDFAAGDLIVSHLDGKTATVSIVWQSTGLSIRTNGKIDATINRDPTREASLDEATMVLSGALPLALHPTAQRAANIGIGSGLTSQILLIAPQLREVDTIEIEQAMVHSAKYFRPRNALVFDDPRSRVFIEDAKTFFSTQDRKYDIIVSEPSNPWVSGVAGLFSLEFYELIARHLNPNGILVQWLQLYEIDIELVASVLKAVAQRFSDFHLYAANDFDVLVVATAEGSVSDPNAGILQNARLAAELQRVGIASLDDLRLRKIADKKLLLGWLNSIQVGANSDYYPKLDLNAERTRFLNLDARALLFLREAPLPALEMLAGEKRLNPEVVITPSRASSLSRRFFAASRMREQILGLPAPGGTRAGTDLAKGIEGAIRECRENKSANSHINLLSKIGFEMVPYVTLAEPEIFWKRVLDLPCGKNVTELDGSWLRFFMAVERRDADRIRELSAELLKRTTTPLHKRYLIAAAVMASKAPVRSEQSIALIQSAKKLPPSNDWSFLMDVMSATR